MKDDEKMKDQVKRDSNLELFRIISMILIIMHHYVVNSGLIEIINTKAFSNTSMFYLIFGAWGKVGINCFVFITGYFMCKSDITIKKIFKLIFALEFYNIIIFMVFYITGYEPFSIEAFVKTLLPINSVKSNFVSCYLIFFLCIPFLNILINHMSKKMHIFLLCILSFTYIVLGTIPKIDVTMNYVSWFCVLYFISAYVRCYSDSKLYSNVKLWRGITCLSLLISILSIFACAYIRIDKAYYFVDDSNKILAVTTGFSLFMLFKNIKIKYNRFINIVASTTLGILLLHANSVTMRRWLWKDILHNVSVYGKENMVLHAFLSVLIVFTICSIIELMRIYFLEKPLMNKLETILFEPLEKWYKNLA